MVGLQNRFLQKQTKKLSQRSQGVSITTRWTKGGGDQAHCRKKR